MTIETLDLQYIAIFIGKNHGTLQNVRGIITVDTIPLDREEIRRNIIAKHKELEGGFDLRQLEVFYKKDFIFD